MRDAQTLFLLALAFNICMLNSWRNDFESRHEFAALWKVLGVLCFLTFVVEFLTGKVSYLMTL